MIYLFEFFRIYLFEFFFRIYLLGFLGFIS